MAIAIRSLDIVTAATILKGSWDLVTEVIYKVTIVIITYYPN